MTTKKAKKKLNIGVITFKGHYESMESEDGGVRYVDEAKNLGHNAEMFYFDKFFVSFKNGKTIVFYDEKKFDYKKFDLIIPVPNSNSEARILLKILEEAGVAMRNSHDAISVSKDKVKTLVVLNKHGLPTIPTSMNFSQYFLGSLLDSFTESEYICKLSKGSLGKGVSYINGRLSLISVFETLCSSGVKPSSVIFEKYIKESAGKDIRVIVVGNKVVAAMMRKSNGFDFRANICGGGQGENYKLSVEMKKMAIKAVKVIGLDYGAVDLIESKDGPLIIEVNANPGLKIEKILNKNVAGEILKTLLK